jgi:MATE family multidrug resistance protein
MAGSLADPETQLAAMSVFQTTNGLSFMVPQGFHVAAAAHVGNALGASDPASAKLSALVAPIGAGLMGATSATLLAVFSNPWARLFTNDHAVASVAAHIFRSLWFYFIADAIQCALTGVVKGAGRQNIGGPVVFASYYLVGLPLAACFAFEVWARLLRMHCSKNSL